MSEGGCYVTSNGNRSHRIVYSAAGIVCQSEGCSSDEDACHCCTVFHQHCHSCGITTPEN